jgi:hypothetical protein
MPLRACYTRTDSGVGTVRWLLLAVIGGLLSSCVSSASETVYQAYRRDPRAALREVARCQSNYAVIGQTPRCRAALRVNAELFPIR